MPTHELPRRRGGPGFASGRSRSRQRRYDEFEMRAICSRLTREVHVRVGADSNDIYISRRCGLARCARHGGLVDCAKPTGAIPPQRRNAAIAVSPCVACR
jgi:hypothetical protein